MFWYLSFFLLSPSVFRSTFVLSFGFGVLLFYVLFSLYGTVVSVFRLWSAANEFRVLVTLRLRGAANVSPLILRPFNFAFWVLPVMLSKLRYCLFGHRGFLITWFSVSHYFALRVLSVMLSKLRYCLFGPRGFLITCFPVFVHMVTVHTDPKWSLAYGASWSRVVPSPLFTPRNSEKFSKHRFDGPDGRYRSCTHFAAYIMPLMAKHTIASL